MVIFESRPDVLPQVASLAIASANGLLLKGGSEASYSNDIMLSVVKSSLQEYDCAEAISMVCLTVIVLSEIYGNNHSFFNDKHYYNISKLNEGFN